jgi:hypothetical protein
VPCLVVSCCPTPPLPSCAHDQVTTTSSNTAGDIALAVETTDVGFASDLISASSVGFTGTSNLMTLSNPDTGTVMQVCQRIQQLHFRSFFPFAAAGGGGVCLWGIPLQAAALSRPCMGAVLMCVGHLCPLGVSCAVSGPGKLRHLYEGPVCHGGSGRNGRHRL